MGMQAVLQTLERDDYAFLVGLIESPLNVTDDQKLKKLYEAYDADQSEFNRNALDRQLEKSIRYLGSSEALYWGRYLFGQEPGTSFRTIILDVGRTLKLNIQTLGTDREVLEGLVQDYATKQFAKLKPEEQQQMLEELGVEREKAAQFIKHSAGVFALPLLIETFNLLVVQGLIKKVIFGTITKIIGTQLAHRLFTFVVGRVPWWVQWIGPAAWTLSIGWTALDIQGPAMRKTVPIVLYLGLCSLRARHAEEEEA